MCQQFMNHRWPEDKPCGLTADPQSQTPVLPWRVEPVFEVFSLQVYSMEATKERQGVRLAVLRADHQESLNRLNIN